MLIYRTVPYKTDNEVKAKIFYEGINLKEKGILVPFKGKLATRIPKYNFGKCNSFANDFNIYKYFYPSLVDAILWGNRCIEDYHRLNHQYENLIMAFDIPFEEIIKFIGLGDYVITNRVEVRLPLNKLYEILNGENNPLWYECLKYYQKIIKWDAFVDSKSYQELIARAEILGQKDLVWDHKIILYLYLAFKIKEKYHILTFGDFSNNQQELFTRALEIKDKRPRKLMEQVNRLRVADLKEKDQEFICNEVLPIVDSENKKLVRVLKKDGIFFEERL